MRVKLNSIQVEHMTINKAEQTGDGRVVAVRLEVRGFQHTLATNYLFFILQGSDIY